MTVYALVDCNNFYASCQRIFQPHLEKKPVVVLSNNDGCIVARSAEAKQLGIPMGAPYYQYRALCQKYKVAVFSSNYEFYGDMSQRVMNSLRRFCPDMEVYSIDEAFLNLTQLSHLKALDYCALIKAKIKQWTGIPVSIGIAPTKTLAKLANHMAKNHASSGIMDLSTYSLQDAALSEIKIEDIWGIGKQLTKKMHRLNIQTAQQLRDSDPKMIRSYFGVTVERTLLELKGVPCFTLKLPQARKTIIASRSFGQPILDLLLLEEAISEYAALASQRLRKQGGKTLGILVFLEANRFQENYYKNSQTQGFTFPTSDTGLIIQSAKALLKKIYIPKKCYKRAGIILFDIIDQHIQMDLLDSNDSTKKDQIMQVMDHINQRMGKGTLFMGAQGIHKTWRMRSDLKTPNYTTRWNEIFSIQL